MNPNDSSVAIHQAGTLVASEAASSNFADTRKNGENETNETQGPRIKWGSKGRSVAFNPFNRTRNIPFSMGRRRSVDVFPTIHEENEPKE